MQAWVHSRKQFILYSEDGRIPAEKNQLHKKLNEYCPEKFWFCLLSFWVLYFTI